MPCYSPLFAWRGAKRANGKREILFKKPAGSNAITEMRLPCGRCVGCRLERSRQWAMRCLDEASLYEKNCFITLTYDDEHLPAGGSLEKRHFQLFMKKLRKWLTEHDSDGKTIPGTWQKVLCPPYVRFFHCGEYGETTARPHYHACLFNCNFNDRVYHRSNRNGDKLYTSDTLSKLWGNGHALIGDVTFESAAYVARYVMKKYYGEKSDEHYLNKTTGEILPAEYVTMSRGSKKLGTGGIGKGWFEKYKTDMYPSDFRIIREMKMKPARFYDKLFSLDNPTMYDIVKARRASYEFNTHRTPSDKKRYRDSVDCFGLDTSREVKEQKMKILSREITNV